VPTSLPTWIEIALPLRREGVPSITACPDVAEEEDRGTGRGRGVVRDRNTPSTPENATKLEPVVSPLLTLPETVAPMELLFVQEKFTSARVVGGSGENVVENLTVVATARHSGGLDLDRLTTGQGVLEEVLLDVMLPAS